MTIVILYHSAHICVAIFLPAYIYPISTLMSLSLKYNDKLELLIDSTSSKHNTSSAYGRFRNEDLFTSPFCSDADRCCWSGITISS